MKNSEENIEVKKLSDLFARYLLGKNGNEDLLENLVNATLKDFNFEEVKDLEIIDPFNLSENIDLKESIIDVKAKTKDNKTVIIEFQLCGNKNFVDRIFYYISKNIVSELHEGEDYQEVQKIISINLLDFNLDFGDEGKPHRCFKLIDTENQNISLDYIQMHIIEVQRFIDILENSTIEELKNNKLLTWMKFFTSKNLDLVENELKEANPIMTKAIEEYKRFTSDDKLMRAYAARDAFLVGQKMMLSREREEGIKEGIKEGIEEGIKKGRREGKLEGIKERNYSIAKTLKQMNMDNASISKATGLSIKEVRKLRPDGEKL